MIESAHGRGAAVATGIKLVRPRNTVFSYQDDGDLAAIGTAEGLHAANRGEDITVMATRLPALTSSAATVWPAARVPMMIASNSLTGGLLVFGARGTAGSG